MTNDDVVKLAKAGMSEAFILDLVKTKQTRFLTDASALIQLKEQGVSEGLLKAMIRKNPPQEAWNSDTVIRLSKAGFSEEFLSQGVKAFSGKYATDTGRLIELKEAGVSENVMNAMVQRSGGNKLPTGTTIAIRMIDSIDSSKAKEGDTFRASLEEPRDCGRRQRRGGGRRRGRGISGDHQGRESSDPFGNRAPVYHPRPAGDLIT